MAASCTARSNIFLLFVCRLVRPEDAEDEAALRPQASEIADARWLEVEAYRSAMRRQCPPGTVYDVMSEAALRCAAAAPLHDAGSVPARQAASGFRAMTLPVGFRPGSNLVYAP